jgi:hypothetical protein
MRFVGGFAFGYAMRSCAVIELFQFLKFRLDDFTDYDLTAPAVRVHSLNSTGTEKAFRSIEARPLKWSTPRYGFATKYGHFKGGRSLTCIAHQNGR